MRVVVIGGGIAGISTAAEIAAHCDVTVVEQEFQSGYHSTGRSAAVLHLAFENDVVHRLTSISERFYLDPPKGFENLVEPIQHIAFDTAANRDLVHSFVEAWIDRCPWLRILSTSELQERAPLLSDHYEVASLDTRSLRLHVDSIVQSYRSLLSERGGAIEHSKRVIDIERRESSWLIQIDRSVPIEADLLINAAGAWADEVATLAGIKTIGLQPRRRTGVIVDPGQSYADHPMCYRASGGIYFKPEGNMLMVSPADATDSPPCDAQPDDFDVAVVLDTLNQCTNLNVERPFSTWAGLRSFVEDGQPVVGFDPNDEQFFWVAALGGFGIQTAPAYSKIASELIGGENATTSELLGVHELRPQRQRNLD